MTQFVELPQNILDYVPLLLYAFDFEDTIGETIPSAMIAYPKMSHRELIESNCFIIHTLVDYVLFGESKGIPISVQDFNMESFDGFYSFTIEPKIVTRRRRTETNNFPGHEFTVEVRGDNIAIFQSYIGVCSLSRKITSKDKLVTLIQMLLDNNFEPTLWNELFNAEEINIPNVEVEITYYPYIGNITNNLNELEKLAQTNREEDLYDYYETVDSIFE